LKGNGIRGTNFLTVGEAYKSVVKALIVMDGWAGLTFFLFKWEEDWMRAPFEKFDGK